MIYKIKKNAKKIEDIKIEVSGITNEFTLKEIKANEDYLTKQKKEIEGMVKVQRAKMVNITRNHPSVARFTPEQLTGAYLYKEASAFVSEAESKLKEINKQLREYKKDRDEIKKQIGLEI